MKRDMAVAGVLRGGAEVASGRGAGWADRQAGGLLGSLYRAGVMVLPGAHPRGLRQA